MRMFSFGNGSNLPHPGNDIVLVTFKGVTYKVDACFEPDTVFMTQDICCPSCGEKNMIPNENDVAIKMYLSSVNEVYNDDTMEAFSSRTRKYKAVVALLEEYLDNAECSVCGYCAPKSFFSIC